MNRIICAVAILILLVSAVAAQSSREHQAKRGGATSSGFQTATTGAVTGGGTPGRVSKWTGLSGTSTFTLGDSNIAEDKFGRVGIGTASPTSALTVQGMIETTLGGLKFPDGTTQ